MSKKGPFLGYALGANEIFPSHEAHAEAGNQPGHLAIIGLAISV